MFDVLLQLSHSLHVDNITFARREWVALSVVLLTALARHDANVGATWCSPVPSRDNGNCKVGAPMSAQDRWVPRLGLTPAVFEGLVAVISGIRAMAPREDGCSRGNTETTGGKDRSTDGNAGSICTKNASTNVED